MHKPIGIFDSGYGGLTVLSDLKKQLPHEFLNAHLLGPGQAFLKRIKNTYRWDILLKAKDRLVLQPILEKAVQFPKKKNVSFSIDVDPYAL
jgi:primosomal protein N'